MTKKDYIKLAEIIGKHMPFTIRATDLLSALVQWLSDDNPRFDRYKFLEAVDKHYTDSI